jgi:hypothetical protein
VLKSLYPRSVPEKSEIDATRFKQNKAEDDIRAIEATTLANNIRVLARANLAKAQINTDGARVNVFKSQEVLIVTSEKSGQYSLQHQTKAGGAIDGGLSRNGMTHTNMIDVITEWLRR